MKTPRLLLAFHTSEGQTAKVADRIAETLGADDIYVDVVAAEAAPSPDDYDGVILGDSIHMTRHSRQLRHYISHHVEKLNSMPVALFQVSLTSASDDEQHTADAHAMLQKLLDDTRLDPDVVGLFAGGLQYTKYGWLKKRVMRSIARKEGGDTDITHDFEYTDWDAVDEFARDFVRVASEAET